MSQPRPGRDAVLAWMEAHSKSAAAAARHFGIPGGTIRSWLTRARRSAGNKAAHRARPGKGRRGSNGAGGGVVLDPAKLDDEARGLLREAAVRRLRFLASEESLENPSGSRSHAVALGILVDKCPGILALGKHGDTEKKPDEEETEEERDAMARRLRFAFGLDDDDEEDEQAAEGAAEEVA